MIKKIMQYKYRITKRMYRTTLFIAMISAGFLYQIQQFAISRTRYNSIIKYELQANNITCYKTPERVLKMADDNFKPPNNSIYFVETSCKGGFNSRQACSVETAARAHPNRSAIVFVTGPLSEQFLEGVLFHKMVTELNIEFVRINVTEYSRGTPLEEMFKKEVLKKSWWPLSHTSDVLRILTLYKYGGLYFDLDVMVLKSFDTLPSNFVVFFNSAIIAVSIDEVGKRYSETAVKELAKTYDPYNFVHNGPELLMRAMGQICDKGKKMNSETCHGFNLLENAQFFPIPYQSWQRYFQDWTMKPSDLYTHHVWNAMAHKTKIPKNCLYVKLAKKYCPTVYSLYGDHFGE